MKGKWKSRKTGKRINVHSQLSYRIIEWKQKSNKILRIRMLLSVSDCDTISNGKCAKSVSFFKLNRMIKYFWYVPYTTLNEKTL